MSTRHNIPSVIFGGLMLVSLANAIPAAAQAPGVLAFQGSANGTSHRRAVEAAISDQPALTFDTLRQIYFRDVRAKHNDLVWGSSVNRKSPTLTPKSDVRYVYAFCDTRIDGPIVYELPASAAGTSFFGSFGGAWHIPLVDWGILSIDTSHGGKFLVLPPGYKGTVPPGYVPVQPATHNVILFNRSVMPKHSEEVVRASAAFVDQIKVIP